MQFITFEEYCLAPWLMIFLHTLENIFNRKTEFKRDNKQIQLIIEGNCE